MPLISSYTCLTWECSSMSGRLAMWVMFKCSSCYSVWDNYAFGLYNKNKISCFIALNQSSVQYPACSASMILRDPTSYPTCLWVWHKYRCSKKQGVYIYFFFLTFLTRAITERGSRALLSLWPPLEIAAWERRWEAVMYDVTGHLLMLGCYGSFGYFDTTEVLQADAEQRSVFHIYRAEWLRVILLATGGCFMIKAEAYLVAALHFPFLYQLIFNLFIFSNHIL